LTFNFGNSKNLSGALTITDRYSSSFATTERNKSDDVKDILGATNDALKNNTTYTYTTEKGSTGVQFKTGNTSATQRVAYIDVNGTSKAIKVVFDGANSTSWDADKVAAQINSTIDGIENHAGKIKASVVTGDNGSRSIKLESTEGTVRMFFTSKANSTTLVNNTGFGTYSNGKFGVDMTSEKVENLDFRDNVAGSTFKLTVNGTTATVSVSQTANSVQDVVDDINKALTDKKMDTVEARIVKDEDGNETVRIFSAGDTSAAKILVSDSADSGTVDAIFGEGTMKRLNGAKGNDSGVAKWSDDGAGIEDIAKDITQGTKFNIMSEDGTAKLATIELSGNYKTDENGTAAEKLVTDLNAQLEKAGLDDFKASLVDDDKNMDAAGNVKMKKLQLASGTRDFKLASAGDSTAIEKIFGKDTNVNAEESEENLVSTIGIVASENTKLRDIDKFWDTEGNFLLTDPQTLTLTQGDGKTATVTLYEYDTVGSMAEKINNAIANDLGQAKYLDQADSNYATAVNKFASFVSNDPSEDDDPNSESVKGTMLIRSITPGSAGSIAFSGNEALVNALSLNTIQGAKESQYRVTVENAHTGKTVVDDAKITGNKLVGALHENIDVEFDAMAGIKATWDDKTNSYKFTDNTTNPKADAYTTYLHLSDNTTVFQIGAKEVEDMVINIVDMRSHALGLDEVNVTSRVRASRSITVIDNAIDKVSMQRSKLGAYQNRLEHT
ncbi:MAG: hypothetical protein IJ684_03415, partial [Bacteroidales bacterium]|nr:hypothetical protein [Bacteroidales bacterium]